MEQESALKQTEGKLAVIADRITTFQAKLEGLLFRAQRIANDQKNQKKSTDTMFGYDLQNFRREMRHFSQEVTTLPPLLTSLERFAVYDEKCHRAAEAVSRAANRLHKGIASLLNHGQLAHQHIREANYKMEAWYMCQEIEDMSSKSQSLPTTAAKMMLKITVAPKIAPEPAVDPAVDPAADPAAIPIEDALAAVDAVLAPTAPSTQIPAQAPAPKPIPATAQKPAPAAPPKPAPKPIPTAAPAQPVAAPKPIPAAAPKPAPKPPGT